MTFELLTDKQIVKNVKILLDFWNKKVKHDPSNEISHVMIGHLLCILTSNLDEDKEKLESLK